MRTSAEQAVGSVTNTGTVGHVVLLFRSRLVADGELRRSSRASIGTKQEASVLLALGPGDFGIQVMAG